MKKALYILGRFEVIYGPQQQQTISRLVDVFAPPQTPATIAQRSDLLKEVEIIFSGWGAPMLNEDFLGKAPKLELILYGAGTVKRFVPETFWDGDIKLCSAWGANAVPVAEFCLSQILFALKRGYRSMRFYAADGHNKRPVFQRPLRGGFGSVVGLISLGMIGKMVAELLSPFDVSVIAYDPFIDAASADELGVELVEFDEVFRRSDVVSLHTPLKAETRGMIRGEHFEMMMPESAFLNTARGAVVCEPEMIEVLARRPDITAILDVTSPEPPVADSLLWSLPNVVLTPHIAGSQGEECFRMAEYMIEDLRNYLEGRPLKHEVDRGTWEMMGAN